MISSRDGSEANNTVITIDNNDDQMKERQRWQPEEDAILKAYVKQYGPRERNLISQRMGGKTLNRDPKSCLERWKNYLKPGIKKGSLTPEEQSLVISLQAKYGNKWKKIASEVPGRTAKRLGKWWEVFKEKQLKQLDKEKKKKEFPDHTHGLHPERNIPVAGSVSGSCSSPEKVAQGRYDHILDTFAEKYVQPKLFALEGLNPVHSALANAVATVVPPILSPLGADPEPVLSLGSGSLWNNPNHRTSCSSLTSSSSSTTTASPSVGLSLSPSEPGELNRTMRFMPGQQAMGTLAQYCKELEEGRQSWEQHKKEAKWRLSRLEQQLESEKARKRREKMEETERKIRDLREEEMTFLGGIESEYKEQMSGLQRDAASTEVKLMEACRSKHVKLLNLVQQIGSVHQTSYTTQRHRGVCISEDLLN